LLLSYLYVLKNLTLVLTLLNSSSKSLSNINKYVSCLVTLNIKIPRSLICVYDINKPRLSTLTKPHLRVILLAIIILTRNLYCTNIILFYFSNK
jgi:hypothetical protein